MNVFVEILVIAGFSLHVTLNPTSRFAETDLQDDLKNFPFTVVEGPGGGILVELLYEKVAFYDL